MCSSPIVPIDVWMIEGLFTHICMKAWRPFIPICVCLWAAIYGSPHLCLLWGPPCMAVPRFSNDCLTLCFPQWQCPHKHCPYCPDYIGAMCNLYVRFEELRKVFCLPAIFSECHTKMALFAKLSVGVIFKKTHWQLLRTKKNDFSVLVRSFIGKNWKTGAALRTKNVFSKIGT